MVLNQTYVIKYVCTKMCIFKTVSNVFCNLKFLHLNSIYHVQYYLIRFASLIGTLDWVKLFFAMILCCGRQFSLFALEPTTPNRWLLLINSVRTPSYSVQLNNTRIGFQRALTIFRLKLRRVYPSVHVFGRYWTGIRADNSEASHEIESKTTERSLYEVGSMNAGRPFQTHRPFYLIAPDIYICKASYSAQSGIRNVLNDEFAQHTSGIFSLVNT